MTQMPRIWQIDDDYPERMIGEYDRKNGPDRFLLKKGQRLSGLGPWRFAVRGRASQVRRLDDVANNAMVPLVSPRLAELLMSVAAEDIELLPAEIEASDGTVGDYRLLNALALVHAVDQEQSEFTLITGSDRIMSFSRLVLRGGCLGDHALARCAEFTSFLLVSGRTAAAIADAAMIGLQLVMPWEIGP